MTWQDLLHSRDCEIRLLEVKIHHYTKKKIPDPHSTVVTLETASVGRKERKPGWQPYLLLLLLLKFWLSCIWIRSRKFNPSIFKWNVLLLMLCPHLLLNEIKRSPKLARQMPLFWVFFSFFLADQFIMNVEFLSNWKMALCQDQQTAKRAGVVRGRKWLPDGTGVLA